MSKAQWGHGFHTGKSEGVGMMVDQGNYVTHELKLMNIDIIVENLAYLLTTEPEQCEKYIIPRAIDTLLTYRLFIERAIDARMLTLADAILKAHPEPIELENGGTAMPVRCDCSACVIARDVLDVAKRAYQEAEK